MESAALLKADGESEPKGGPTSGRCKRIVCASSRKGWVVRAIIFLVFALALAVSVAALAGAFRRRPSVIFFVSDGFGPVGATMSREYVDKSVMQPLDGILRGTSITYSSNSLVTDSAAGATAFACALKTYNGAIGVDAEGAACATLLEAAATAGMATGVVVTSRVTHATGASFTAHVDSRIAEAAIAEQMLSQNLDVLFGGGMCAFLPETDGKNVSCRQDNLNLVEQVQNAGIALITDVSQLEVAIKTPIVGLFANSHMDFEIDRNPNVQPSLAQMTTKALQLLDTTDKAGFFLLVEGSRIDMAAHNNDPAAYVRDALAFQAAIQVAIDYASASGNVLVISVSDHETGGLTLGRTVNNTGTYDIDYPYAWYPNVLAKVSHSTEYLASLLLDEPNLSISDCLATYMGITNLSQDEIVAMSTARTDSYQSLTYALGQPSSLRSQVGWTTHGHTGTDVNLYAFGRGADLFNGVQQNIEIGSKIEGLLGFDLTALTPSIQKRFPPTNTNTTGGTITDVTAVLYGHAPAVERA